MAILGITNRTENWKTASYFAPLFGHGAVRLARLLLKDEESADLHPGEVHLELFWKGLRDHRDQVRTRKPDDDVTDEQLAAAYSEQFRGLRDRVETWKGFSKPQPDHYIDSDKAKLASNLLNTEIDIVLESPSHLFIGEAKHVMTFGANGKDVLVHQLIREYVTAHVLLHLREEKRTVVPFVVGDSRESLMRQEQVRFMTQPQQDEEPWMREGNVLTWREIEALW